MESQVRKLLFGIGLWLVLGWVIFRIFGHRIFFDIWFGATVTGLGMIWNYASILERNEKSQQAREIREIKSQLDGIETAIGYLRREIRDISRK